MADWNPALYRRFESERTRPAIELLARVPLDDARCVVDLGCGPGNSTELLAARWPQAKVVGIDSSEAMLDSARERLPHLHVERADVAGWQPARAPDLISPTRCCSGCRGTRRCSRGCSRCWRRAACWRCRCPTTRRAQPSARCATPPRCRLVAVAGRHRRAARETAGRRGLLRPAGAAGGLCRHLAHSSIATLMDSPEAIVDWLRSTGLRVLSTRCLEDPARRLPERLPRAHRRRLPGAQRRAPAAGLSRSFIVARRPSMNAPVHPRIALYDLTKRRPPPCPSATTTAASKCACARAWSCRPSWGRCSTSRSTARTARRSAASTNTRC